MKYPAPVFISFLFIFIVSGCSITDHNDSSTTSNSTTYGLQAQRTTIDENIISSRRIGGGYYSERFQFFEEDSLRIEIESDIVSENGYAKATYQIEDSHLSSTISTSTTSKYTTGGQITFSKVRFVDESYSQTFSSNGESYTFEGPGLLLEQQYADGQDLDNDSNTSEKVTQTKFYNRLVEYDDGDK